MIGKMNKKQSSMPSKHIPIRTCAVCKVKSDKRHLTRIVRTTDAGVQVDPTGKHKGRGAYLCDDERCWELAVKTNVLNKALRTTLTDEDRSRLAQSAPQS